MSGFSAPEAKTFGKDQIWQDVKADRAGSSTVYQNTTGQTIAIFTQSNGGSFQVSSDNLNWIILSYPRNFGECAIVPPGSYYRYTGTTIPFWVEMRVPA